VTSPEPMAAPGPKDPMGAMGIRGTDRPLVELYDAALLDLDGVVYLGPEPVPGAAVALAQARRRGMRLAFVTNNASRDAASVAEHLTELGVPAAAPDVVMSSQAATRVLHEQLGSGASVLVTGSPALRSIVETAGFRTVESADDRPDGVVQGFFNGLSYADLVETVLAVRAGALWVATNVDSTLPSPRGLLPGNGSLVGLVSIATGRQPVVAGKPALPLHAEAVERTGAKHPLVVGDRLDTDIEGANAAATDSLLVLTGVTTPAELLAAAPGQRPTYLSADLSGLLEPHPFVEPAEGGFRCGGWTAKTDAGRIEITGHGDAVDGLRLLATLCWTTQPVPDTSAALAALGLR
jgi:glycerol 3-phosphatase-2